MNSPAAPQRLAGPVDGVMGFCGHSPLLQMNETAEKERMGREGEGEDLVN